MTIVKTLLVSLAFAFVGGIVGHMIFAFQVQRGWWDGPGGEMMLFPMVLIPAFGGGLYGFTFGLKKFQKPSLGPLCLKFTYVEMGRLRTGQHPGGT
jgi:hypothetical protein